MAEDKIAIEGKSSHSTHAVSGNEVKIDITNENGCITVIHPGERKVFATPANEAAGFREFLKERTNSILLNVPGEDLLQLYIGHHRGKVTSHEFDQKIKAYQDGNLGGQMSQQNRKELEEMAKELGLDADSDIAKMLQGAEDRSAGVEEVVKPAAPGSSCRR